MEFKDVINTRRSVRTFSNKKITRDDIIDILKCAMQSPSARNQQPWHFLVIEDSKVLEEIANISPNYQLIKNANIAIVFLTDKSNLTTPQMYCQDMSSAVLASLLAARDKNIGSCWCGTYPNEERMNKVMEVIKVNTQYEPFAVVGFGYPQSDDAFNYKNRFDETRIHFGKI